MGRRGVGLRYVITAALVALVLVVALGIARPATAYACSCAIESSPTATLERSDLAFAGELVRIDRPASDGSSGASQQLRFEVTRVYKGDVAAKTTVHTAQSSSSCGLGLEEPGPYVIFGRGGGTDVSSALCDSPITGTAVPAAFGAGREPTPTGADPWSVHAPNPAVRIAAVVGGLVVLAGAAFAVVVVRRRRHRA